MKTFAIVIVCYNRLMCVKRLLNFLENVDFEERKDITLIFSIDYSGSEDIVNYANSYRWSFGKKIVRNFKERQGLRNHVIQCGEFTKDFDFVAVLEDDIIVSSQFYRFGYNAALFYENDDRIAGISLYSFQKNWLKWIYRFEPERSDSDVYFMKIAQSWGQIWSKKKWNKFITWYFKNINCFPNKNVPEYLNTWPESSWLKYHTKYCIDNDLYFVYPYMSISTNCSQNGEHVKITVTDHQVELINRKYDFKFEKFTPDSIIYDEYMDRIGLEKYLHLSEFSVCVDFWGTKKEFIGYDYLLTTNEYELELINSFELGLRPIELGVILNYQGRGINLYKLNSNSYPKLVKSGEVKLLIYTLRYSDIVMLWKKTFPLFTRSLVQKILCKFGIFK